MYNAYVYIIHALYVMLWYDMLCLAMLCSAMLRYGVTCYAMLWCGMGLAMGMFMLLGMVGVWCGYGYLRVWVHVCFGYGVVCGSMVYFGAGWRG